MASLGSTEETVVLRQNSTKHLKTFINNGTCKPLVSNLRNMSQKVKQDKSYLAVNITESSATNPERGFWAFFRRKTAKKVDPNQATIVTNSRLKKSDLRRLFSLAKPERWRLFGAIGFLVVSSTVTMAIPFSLGKVLDIIYNSSSNADEARIKLNKLCGILICVFVLGAVCNYGRIYLMSVSGYRMTQSLRTKVFSSVIKQEQGWFDKRSTGELINRLSSDTQIVGQALSSNISDGLRSLAMICCGTGMMFYMSPQLALVGLAVVPPIAGIAVVYGRFVRRITKQVQDSLAAATQVAEERIANMRTVKTFAREDRENNMYANSITNVLLLGYREAKARAIFYGMAGLSGNLVIISVLYYGGVMVSTQAMTVGNLTSFLLYAAYIGVSVGGLSTFYTELNKSIGAASRIWEIIDRDPVIPAKGGLVPNASPKGHIEFNNITFSYPSREEITVLDHLNLEITPGKMVAVVGPSGAGKSTLAALLLRLYDPQGGSVILDSFNIKDLDPSWVRKHIGTVSQEPVLFSSSIKENILYGAEEPENVTDEELIKTAKEANVFEFVQNLPDGFDTLVGERGIMLSGGQKQRVAIARALIKDPKILLLDEATSALDAQSEKLVQEALERIMKHRTVLTIAHRLSTIQNADTIAVLKNGKIVESGSYSELSNKENGAFMKLMQHQTFQGQSVKDS